MTRQPERILQENALWGFARKTRTQEGKVRLRLRWGRIGITATTLAVAGWFLLAGLLYFFFKTRRGYEEVQYAKMLVLPFRYDQHRQEMGDFYINKALVEMEERNFRSAVLLLRAGVNLSPQNKQGRILLSEFYEFGQNRPDLAVEVLQGGLRFADTSPEFHSRDYLQRMFRAFLSNAMDDKAYALSRELMPIMENDPEITQLLAYIAALSRIFRGHFSEAREILATHNFQGSPDGFILETRMLWAQGRQTDAFNTLEAGLTRFPTNDLIRELAVSLYLEAGNLTRARQLAQQRIMLNPENARARLDLAQTNGRLNRTDAMLRDAESLLEQAGGDRALLIAVASLAAETRNIELAERVISEASRTGEVDIELFYAGLSAFASAGEFRRGWDILNEFLRNPPPELDRFRAQQLGLQSIFTLGLGRDADSARFLRELFQTPVASPQVYLGLARIFRKLEAYTQSFQVLDFYNRQRRGNRAILLALVELQMEHQVGDRLPDHISQLIVQRRPPFPILEQAFLRLGSDQFLFHPLRDDLVERLSTMVRS